MSLPAIEWDTGMTAVSFSDERERACTQKAPPDAFASVTLSGLDSSWGEFLTREQTLGLIGWLTSLVASEAIVAGGDQAQEAV
jgi:hypothetical protein